MVRTFGCLGATRVIAAQSFQAADSWVIVARTGIALHSSPKALSGQQQWFRRGQWHAHLVAAENSVASNAACSGGPCHSLRRTGEVDRNALHLTWVPSNGYEAHLKVQPSLVRGSMLRFCMPGLEDDTRLHLHFSLVEFCPHNCSFPFVRCTKTQPRRCECGPGIAAVNCLPEKLVTFEDSRRSFRHLLVVLGRLRWAPVLARAIVASPAVRVTIWVFTISGSLAVADFIGSMVVSCVGGPRRTH